MWWDVKYVLTVLPATVTKCIVLRGRTCAIRTMRFMLNVTAFEINAMLWYIIIFLLLNQVDTRLHQASLRI